MTLKPLGRGGAVITRARDGVMVDAPGAVKHNLASNVATLDKKERRGMAGEGDVRAILSRIDERLKKVGLTDRGASLAAGMSADLIRSMRKQSSRGSQHGVMLSTLDALAVPLKTTTEWLLTGKGQKESDRMQVATPRIATRGRATIGTTASAPTIPCIGIVAAGTWYEQTPLGPDHKLEQYHVPADPRFPIERQFAVYLNGTSLNRLLHQGDFLMVLSGSEPRSGDVVLVERIKGGLHEVSPKRYVQLNHGFELHYDSVDPRWINQPPIRLPHPDLKEEDDDAQVVIRGVIIGMYRAMGS